MCGAIFGQIEGSRPRGVRMVDAIKAAASVLVILVLAALFGTKILQIFSVSLDAFSVAGGGVLSWIGFGMLRGNVASPQGVRPDGASQKASLTPLILFAASPGTITGVITLATAHTRFAFPVTALVAVAVATGVMWLVILLAISMGDPSHGPGFVHDTVTRFMGLIVIAMGVQFALTGIRAFFAPNS
jgi:multiple antibiotic resistance protein